MKLYLTRHGQTDWNTQRRICGRTQAQLTDLGREQAAQTGELAAQKGIDLILVSPLDRAQETAAIISEKTGAPVVTEPLLIEQDFGAFEGESVDNPEYREKRNNLFWRFEGGESSVQLMHRAYSAIEKVKALYSDKTVLLVAHGCFSRAARTYFVEVPDGGYYDFYMENCALLEFTL